MARHASSNSPCSNRRAFLLSADAALAVAIALLVLLAAAQLQRTRSDTLSQLALGQTGHDVIAALDNQGTLDTLDAASVRTAASALLPVSRTMRIRLACQNAGTATTNETLPSGRFVASGKRDFIVSSGGSVTDFCVATWWMWNT